MSRAPFILIDGRLYRWKDILEPRRAQLAAAGAHRQASLRCSRPCTTTAAHPPSARHRDAICNQACLPHYQAAIGNNSVIFGEVQKQPESLTSVNGLAKLSKHD
jgi:hypothetical protein